MAEGKFSIDDAFQSDEEDPIRVYGAVSEIAPLKKKVRVPPSDSESGLASTSTQPYAPLPRTEVDLNTGNSDGSNEMTDTSVGLLSGQIENRHLYRAASAHSFNSSSSGTISAKTYTDKRWWKHPRIRENWKIVLASFILLVLGLGLFVAGAVIEISHSTGAQSFIFFIAGAICLIPGVYHVVYIYCAVKGKRGFTFYNLPSFK